MGDQRGREKAPKPGDGGIRIFVMNHSQLITFVGAFIVFATFMVREEVREGLKDLVASTESAQTVFATRRDISTIAGQLNTIGIITADMAFSVIKGKTAADERTGAILAFRFRVFAIKDYAASQGAFLDNISRLMAKLDPDATQAKHVAELRTRLLDLQKKCDEAAAHLNPWEVDRKTIRTNGKQASKIGAEYAWVMPLIGRSGDLDPDIQKVADDVLKLAEAAKRQREREYRLVNWLSIGLFTVGWGLGLAAKTYRVDGASEES
jgi:hypothetical protein